MQILYSVKDSTVNMSSGSNCYEWQIIDRIKETHNVFTYVLDPVSDSQRFSFEVGQFVMLCTFLKRPTASGNSEESFVERAYSISSSPLRRHLELTIKDEKPYGYINPKTGKADGFAPYFFEQIRTGDKVSLKFGLRKEHFMSKIANGTEKNIAYWSGSNGAEPARCLIQYIEDIKDSEYNLTLFYSNPTLYFPEDNSINVIYYNWMIDMARKMDKFKLVFTFTKDQDLPDSEHPRVKYRKGRFFLNQDCSEEKTLSKYHTSVDNCFNPICGSSAFINGTVKLPDGRIRRGKGIKQDLMEIEGIKSEKLDIEQFYLQHAN